MMVTSRLWLKTALQVFLCKEIIYVNNKCNRLFQINIKNTGYYRPVHDTVKMPKPNFIP